MVSQLIGSGLSMEFEHLEILLDLLVEFLLGDFVILIEETVLLLPETGLQVIQLIAIVLHRAELKETDCEWFEDCDSVDIQLILQLEELAGENIDEITLNVDEEGL